MSRREPSLLETLKESGLPQVLLTQHPEALSERIRTAFPLAERPQIHQEGDRFVVFTRLPSTDQITGQFPGGIFSLCERPSSQSTSARRTNAPSAAPDCLRSHRQWYSSVKLVAVILVRVADFRLLSSGQRTIHREELVVLVLTYRPARPIPRR